MQIMINRPDADHHPAVVTGPVIIDTVAAIAASLATTVEDACLSICKEFAVINRALGQAEAGEIPTAAARDSYRYVMQAMQFQDRHNQAMQDIVVMLHYLRELISGEKDEMPIDISCARLQLREIRDMLRQLSDHNPSCRVPAALEEAGAVELF